MSEFKVFYSWQSDLPGKETRHFIKECIDDAIAFAEKTEAIEAIRDEATKGTTGSPNIPTTLLSKIDESDLFVADISLCYTGDIEKEGKHQQSPNPNVLLELGYAVKRLTWDRVICICDEDYGKDLPFDIAQNRIQFYRLKGKDRKEVKREVSKAILFDIQKLKGQVPNGKPGTARHIVGTYDYLSQSVISELVAMELGDTDNYKRHNEELLDSANQLFSEIQQITDKMMVLKERQEEYGKLAKAITIPKLNLPTIEKPSFQTAIEATIANSVTTIKEEPIVWDTISADRELISTWLGFNVEDSFFTFGNMKKSITFLNQVSLQGTEDEKAKYEKLQDLSWTLSLLDLRTKYLKTFDNTKFFQLAIQNVSSVSDSDVRIVVMVEAGEIVEPDEKLIIPDYDGCQGMLCSTEDESGIIPELFLLKEDGNIHVEEGQLQRKEYPSFPIVTPSGVMMHGKTAEDYRMELEDYIASTEGKGYYEFYVRAIRPNECYWLSQGILVKPVGGRIALKYRIHSQNSTGDLQGKLTADY